ncbi:MAG: SDR family oxidoreductase [Gammaproteobacteria bacterium]|nr:SDR family oxidoreductase [Gammaproteobacteria bacterium]
MQTALIIGCGAAGTGIGARHVQRQDRVHGSTRDPKRASELSRLGIQPVLLDLDSPDPNCELPGDVAYLYYCAPPPPGGQTDPRLVRAMNMLAEAPPPARIIYLSTTGVYGDCGGERVTESRALNPMTDRAKRRVSAEKSATGWCEKHGTEFVILRVSAIYGPGRLPLQRLREGKPVLRAEESGPGNRIHLDDLAEICVAAAERAPAGSIYNVSDGNSMPSADFMREVAAQAGLPAPRTISMQEAKTSLTESSLSFLRESRLIDNSKMLSELDIKLRYADPKDGIRASLKYSK